MSIGSLNPYAMVTTLQRNLVEEQGLKKSRNAALLAEPDKPSKSERVAPSLKNDESSAHQQAYDEAFARTLVTFNSASAQASGDTSQSSEQTLTVNESKGTARQSAVDEFMAYMAMTPAEKMRDKILKEVGITEEDLENMQPEQRVAAEREIAEKLQMLQELKAVQDEDGTLHEHA